MCQLVLSNTIEGRWMIGCVRHAGMVVAREGKAERERGRSAEHAMRRRLEVKLRPKNARPELVKAQKGLAVAN